MRFLASPNGKGFARLTAHPSLAGSGSSPDHYTQAFWQCWNAWVNAYPPGERLPLTESVQGLDREQLFDQDIILQLQVVTLVFEVFKHFCAIFPGEFAALGQVETETEFG